MIKYVGGRCEFTIYCFLLFCANGRKIKIKPGLGIGGGGGCIYYYFAVAVNRRTRSTYLVPL